jgi:hypothetical protein
VSEACVLGPSTAAEKRRWDPWAPRDGANNLHGTKSVKSATWGTKMQCSFVAGGPAKPNVNYYTHFVDHFRSISQDRTMPRASLTLCYYCISFAWHCHSVFLLLRGLAAT